MARTAGRGRAVTPERSPGRKAPASPGTVADGIVLLVAGISAGVVFGSYSGARDWAVGVLAYGWAPVCLWLAAALLTLRYNHRALAVHWRWWVGLAALAAMSVGALSTVRPEEGALAEHGLGGDLGGVLGGTPIILGVLKLAGIAIVVPLLLYPWKVGTAYYRFLYRVWMLTANAMIYTYWVGYHVERWSRQQILAVIHSYRLRLFLSWVKESAFRRQPAIQDRVTSVSTLPDDIVPDTDQSEDTPNLWVGTAPGTIPDWVTSEPDPAAASAILPSTGKGKSRWQLPSVDLLTPAEQKNKLEEPL